MQITIEIKELDTFREAIKRMEETIASLKAENAELNRRMDEFATMTKPKPKLQFPSEHARPEVKKTAWMNIDKLMQAPFLVLDTETADMKGEIISIAIINREGDRVFESLIKPQGVIAAGATAVHGITSEMVATAPTFPDVWRRLQPVLEGIKVVSYNSFDQDRLKQDLQLHAISISSQWDWFDVMPVVANYLGITWFEGRYGKAGSYKFEKLTDVCELLGVQLPDEKAHSAMGDVLRTLEVIKAIHERGLA